jgi:hypothetical protein
LKSPDPGGVLLLAEVEEAGGVASLPQLNTGAVSVPANCIPKVVEAPGASLPFHAALTAVAAWPDVLTTAFHVLTIRWPSAIAHVTDQVVAVVAAVLATVTLTTAPAVEPLPQREAISAVAWHPPAPVSAEAVPTAPDSVVNAVIAVSPTASAGAPRVHRLDNAMSTHSFNH